VARFLLTKVVCLYSSQGRGVLGESLLSSVRGELVLRIGGVGHTEVVGLLVSNAEV